MIPVLADSPVSGQASRIGRGRNEITKLGDLGLQWSHLCEAEGHLRLEPAATILLDHYGSPLIDMVC